MIKEQILHAFKLLKLEAPIFEVEQTDRYIAIDQTRIKFDLHCYAFLGYQSLADFVKACWKEPQKIVDEFIVAGLVSSKKASISASVCYEELEELGLTPKTWQVGTKFNVNELIVVPYERKKEEEQYFTLWNAFEVNGFFSKEPELVILPQSYKVKRVSYSSYKRQVAYEDYEETVHSLTGLACDN